MVFALIRQTVTAERITEDADYQGIRVRFLGHLENARIPIQVDLGFGDVITPAPVQTEIASLLDLPNPKLKAYPRESVVSEKVSHRILMSTVDCSNAQGTMIPAMLSV